MIMNFKEKIRLSVLLSIVSWVLCAVSVFLIVFAVLRWEEVKNGEGYRLITEGTTVVDIEVYTEDDITVVIPEGIKVIGEQAFKDAINNLSAVVFPETLVVIETGAFSECYKLTSIAFPHSLAYIGPAAFHRCMRLSSVESFEGRLYNGREYGAEEQEELVTLVTSRNSETGITVSSKAKP